MERRAFLKRAGLGAAGMLLFSGRLYSEDTPATAAPRDWLPRWDAHLTAEAAHNRYCDHEIGEEIGWLISPFLDAYYYGYLATRDAKWVDSFVDWADSWMKRGVSEPDGYIGWPKNGTGGQYAREFNTDSLLGEAMAFRPTVLMAEEIRKTPALKAKHGKRADAWLELAERTFDKWNSRDCWRDVKEGGLWVVPDFGIDAGTGRFTDGYARRATEGFSNPDNKQNLIARWMLAMFDATAKAVYRERAGKWFKLMRYRMRTREDGKYFVWDYWEPGGPWDYKSGGSTRHWVGVHPNGGYYAIDLEGIVAAYEHGIVFTTDDIQRLISTNRDFMWNHQIDGAKFQRIDGGSPDSRWKDTPGVLWTALVPYDETLRKIFIANNNPTSWGGMVATPRFLAREAAQTSNK